MKMTRTAPAITWLTIAALLISMCASLAFTRNTSAQAAELDTHASDARATLIKYTVDLTRLASQRRLEPVQGFDAEIARVIAQLSSATSKAPIVVGESDTDRGAIARGVAFRLLSGDAPENLRSKKILSLNLDALAKGAKTSAQFEQRVQEVFTAAELVRNEVILFVDQLHQYAGARATTNATATVKAAIETSHLFVIAGTSPEAYSSYIAADQSVAKLFESITIDGTTEVAATATSTDKRKSPINEEFEGEKIAPAMRELMRSAGSNGRVSAILQVSDVNSREVRALLARNGVLLGDTMPKLGAMKVDLPAQAISSLMKHESMNYISPDVQIQSLGHVNATTGADQVRNAPGLIGSLLGATAIDGTGVTIAVVDSGMDLSHVAFQPSGRMKYKKDFTTENKPDKDYYGHGTHVASLAVGNYTNGTGTSYQGIAYNANFVNLRVLDANGIGSTSTLLAALNWFLTPADPTKPLSGSNPMNKDKYGIRVVNISLGAPAVSSYQNDPVCRAARALVDAGLVVVAAAGNNGKDANGNKIYGQIHSPGNEPSVITVGAANTFGTDSHVDDGVATYSSRGPTRSYYTDDAGVRHYDNLLKPDLIAPGNKLINSEADDGSSNPNNLVKQNPQLDAGISGSDNKKMMYLSGTSMATPVVAGAAALMLQINPKLTPNMVKMALMYTADPLPGWNMLEQGTGEVNIEGAARLAKVIRTDLSSSTPQDSAIFPAHWDPKLRIPRGQVVAAASIVSPKY